jgi:AraC-like DNA-binding protein
MSAAELALPPQVIRSAAHPPVTTSAISSPLARQMTRLGAASAAGAAAIPASCSGKHRLTWPAALWDWIMNRRLDTAHRRLAAGEERAISEIAHQCGFSNFAHFTRRFRQR